MANLNYRAGDFLIRVKNAKMAGLDSLSLTNTKLIKSIAQALKKEGFLDEINIKDGNLTVKIKKSHKKPVIRDIKLISKPGLRIYKSVGELKKRKAGSSILLLSTSKGIKSNKDAIKENIGGEVIVEIW